MCYDANSFVLLFFREECSKARAQNIAQVYVEVERG